MIFNQKIFVSLTCWCFDGRKKDYEEVEDALKEKSFEAK